jgi:CRP-like cAMP-binding protein
MQFTKLLFIVLFIAHWGACFWFFIGYSEFYANGVSWLSHSDLLDKSEGDQYISSIYFYITTMTTVGYGDIIPITMLEKIYCMLSMLIACGVFAYVIGSIGTVLSSRYDEEIIFKQKIMYVDQFLIKKHINKSLRTKVRKYLEHVLEDKKDNKIDESEVLSLLNKNLKDEVIMHLNGLFLKNLTFSILHKYEEFCLLLTNIMKEETLNPSDMIFQQGDLSLRIYFINSGVVTLYDQDTKIIYQELDNKTNINFFGEIGFFGGIKRSTSAEARTFTSLTYILLDLFKESAAIFRKRNESKFKELEKDLNQIRKEIRDRDYKKLKLNCYFCHSTEHIAKDCFKMNSLDEYFRLKFKDKKHRTEQELKKIFDLRNINRQFSFKGSRKMSVISQQSFIKNTREQFFSKKDFNSFEEEVLNKDNKIEEHSHSSRSSISDINSKDPSVNSEKVINDSKYSR